MKTSPAFFKQGQTRSCTKEKCRCSCIVGHNKSLRRTQQPLNVIKITIHNILILIDLILLLEQDD
jgi:hypothetical protein